MVTRNEQLQIRVTMAEKAAIRAAAERAQMGMSQWVLARALPSAARRVAALVEILSQDDSSAAWAELIDLMQSSGPLEFNAAVSGIEVTGLSARDANYLAALTEMRAHQLEVAAPAWTRRVLPLETPWFGTSLRRLREHLLVNAPVAFRRRNLFVDAAVGSRV